LSQKAVDHLRAATFIPGLKASSMLEAIEQMLGALQNHPDVLDPATLRQEVLARQEIDPPLLPSGIALPHARTDSVRSLVMAAATTAAPLTVEETAVRLIFLVGVPKSAAVQYLELVSSLSRNLRNAGAVERVCRVSSKEELLSALGGN